MSRSWVTFTLLGLNIVVFGAMAVSGTSFDDVQQVLRWGANFGPLTLRGEWWRLVTAMFLHFGFLHLAFNMWALFSVGRVAEAVWGSRTFLMLYLLSGVGASLASLLAHPLGVGAGASGAIFGVAGGLIITLTWKSQQGSPRVAMLRPLLPSLLSFVCYNLVIGMQTTGTDNVAHLGGLVTGASFAAAVLRWPTVSPGVAAVFVVALSAVAYATARVDARTDGMYVAPLPDVGATVARLERVVARHPDSIEAYTALGTAYMEARRFEDAVRVLEHAQRARPTDVAVLTALGTAHLTLRQLDEAIVAFDRAAQLDPSSADARYNLATAYLARAVTLVDSGKSVLARADFEHVLEVSSDSALRAEARRQLRHLVHPR